MKKQITVGETYSVRYPFMRTTYELPTDDPEATQIATVAAWHPGAEFVHDDNDYATVAVVDGEGEMLLTVISTHKPGKFPERVFYTRQWKDPEGKVFGKGSLRVTTTGVFRRLLRGYRHGYESPNARANGQPQPPI